MSLRNYYYYYFFCFEGGGVRERGEIFLIHIEDMGVFASILLCLDPGTREFPVREPNEVVNH